MKNPGRAGVRMLDCWVDSNGSWPDDTSPRGSPVQTQSTARLFNMVGASTSVLPHTFGSRLGLKVTKIVPLVPTAMPVTYLLLIVLGHPSL